MLQIAGDGGLLSRPVTRRLPMHPAERVDMVLDFSAYGPGEQLVLYNLDGAGRHRPVMRFDVEGGRVSEEFQVPRRLRQPDPLPAPNARRRWSSRSARPRGRSTASGATRTASTSGRAAAAPRSGRSSTTPTACTRCTCTGSCSACWSARAAGRAGRQARLEGHGRRAAQRDRQRARVVRALPRQVRLPLPRARARGQGHDAADGDRVMRAIARRRSPRCSPSRAPPRRRHHPGRRRHRNDLDNAPGTSRSRSARRSAGPSRAPRPAQCEGRPAELGARDPIPDGRPHGDETVRRARDLQVPVPAAQVVHDRHRDRHRRGRRPPPPPPPPPLSEQPFGNDTPPLSVFEVRDTFVPSSTA